MEIPNIGGFRTRGFPDVSASPICYTGDTTISIDDCCGAFHAWIVSDDWCEYFSDCRQGPGMSAELDGRCVHIHGTIEKKMGRVRIEVTDRSQIEFIDCDTCQIPDACGPHR